MLTQQSSSSFLYVFAIVFISAITYNSFLIVIKNINTFKKGFGRLDQAL